MTTTQYIFSVSVLYFSKVGNVTRYDWIQLAVHLWAAMGTILKLVTRSRQVTPRSAINIHRFVTMSQLLDKIPDVDIDGHGKFKYILITVEDETNKASKQIVRGYARAQWHAFYHQFS
ncbi:hypothetical protein DMN91_002351 [Ooceraea biroi]|uniref:Uncharacterized protein n=1 Tax=Ooceraea biroi TaxID=2015173 RepID=A0A3L8E1B9_OOCBI|nr:hypothetical protein DMN91_002351 [Ooceraea biroi]